VPSALEPIWSWWATNTRTVGFSAGGMPPSHRRWLRKPLAVFWCPSS